MRQKNDQDFAELLCRMRLSKCTEEDISVLSSKEIDPSDDDYPHDALHVFALNKDVDDWNAKQLHKLAPNDEDRIRIAAVDDHKDSTGLVNLNKMPSRSVSRSETGGLHTVLEVAIGARVMLVYNVDTSDGLVNGVIGKVAQLS